MERKKLTDSKRLSIDTVRKKQTSVQSSKKWVRCDEALLDFEYEQNKHIKGRFYLGFFVRGLEDVQ